MRRRRQENNSRRIEHYTETSIGMTDKHFEVRVFHGGRTRPSSRVFKSRSRYIPVSEALGRHVSNDHVFG